MKNFAALLGISSCCSLVASLVLSVALPPKTMTVETTATSAPIDFPATTAAPVSADVVIPPGCDPGPYPGLEDIKAYPSAGAPVCPPMSHIDLACMAMAKDRYLRDVAAADLQWRLDYCVCVTSGGLPSDVADCIFAAAARFQGAITAAKHIYVFYSAGCCDGLNPGGFPSAYDPTPPCNPGNAPGYQEDLDFPDHQANPCVEGQHVSLTCIESYRGIYKSQIVTLNQQYQADFCACVAAGGLPSDVADCIFAAAQRYYDAVKWQRQLYLIQQQLCCVLNGSGN